MRKSPLRGEKAHYGAKKLTMVQKHSSQREKAQKGVKLALGRPRRRLELVIPAQNFSLVSWLRKKGNKTKRCYLSLRLGTFSYTCTPVWTPFPSSTSQLHSYILIWIEKNHPSLIDRKSFSIGECANSSSKLCTKPQPQISPTPASLYPSLKYGVIWWELYYHWFDKYLPLDLTFRVFCRLFCKPWLIASRTLSLQLHHGEEGTYIEFESLVLFRCSYCDTNGCTD